MISLILSSVKFGSASNFLRLYSSIVFCNPSIKPKNAVSDVFGTKEKTDIQTISAQSIQLDFILAPADVVAEQIVTIEADTSAIDTTRTIVGGTIAGRDIEEIPNNSRNPLDLVLTLGGTSEEALSTRNLAEDRNVTNSTAPAELIQLVQGL